MGVSLCSESRCEGGWLGGKDGGRDLVKGTIAEQRVGDVAAAFGETDAGGVVPAYP